MDCNTARMLVTFFGRQGTELAPEDAADLNAHLAGCPACAAAVRFERAFDDRVAKAMLAVPVPDEPQSQTAGRRRRPPGGVVPAEVLRPGRAGRGSSPRASAGSSPGRSSRPRS